MIDLSNETILYHGSYIAVPEIDLSFCNPGLDFGRGFYLTTSYEQAASFVVNSVKRNIRAGKIPKDFNVDDGCISIFKYHSNPVLRVELFQEANLDWLHFVATNRNHRLFPELYDRLKDHDIIGGKIADDDTSRVLNAYVTGLYGVPGSDLADAFTVQSLLPNRLEDQYCFRTDKAIMALEFLGSVCYGDYRKQKSNN